jgi:hypothetical protein
MNHNEGEAMTEHLGQAVCDGVDLFRREDLTLDMIDAHVRSLDLRSHLNWRGGQWTVRLTARKDEHQKKLGRQAVGRSPLIEEAFEKALEEWSTTVSSEKVSRD